MGFLSFAKHTLGRVQVFAGAYDNAVFLLPTVALVLDDDQEEHEQIMSRDPVWRPTMDVRVPASYVGVVLHWLHLQLTVRIRVGDSYTPPPFNRT